MLKCIQISSILTLQGCKMILFMNNVQLYFTLMKNSKSYTILSGQRSVLKIILPESSVVDMYYL